MDINAKIEEIANLLNKRIADSGTEKTAVVEVTATAFLSLGFSPAALVSVETLKKALEDMFINNIQLSLTDTLDAVHLVEVRDE